MKPFLILDYELVSAKNLQLSLSQADCAMSEKFKKVDVAEIAKLFEVREFVMLKFSQILHGKFAQKT